MAFIIWSSSLSVGVKVMDDQHRILIDIINQLYEATYSGKGNLEMGEIINRMVDYTRFHFSSEEKLLSVNDYPEYKIQKKEHDAFTRKVVDFQNQFRKVNISLTMDILIFLKNWWIKHIQGEDKKYTVFMNKKSVF